MRRDDVRFATAARDDGIRKISKYTWRAGAAGVACSALIAVAFGHHVATHQLAAGQQRRRWRQRQGRRNGGGLTAGQLRPGQLRPAAAAAAAAAAIRAMAGSWSRAASRFLRGRRPGHVGSVVTTLAVGTDTFSVFGTTATLLTVSLA